ncbi:MAG: hypothetical protein J7623_22100 [Chitinophaga sp.]|uniref:hypothetical protein n=1 Tax=Chitinophaga sp. TaxID=1869181 RepID=UPI001B2EDE9B|nr:hypothetical protein [Chitinophaga sp.]MBO9731348.1 hypothetical protein [Chitinophaga sp.]
MGFLSTLILSYSVSTILFLLIVWCYQPFRKIRNSYLSISNLIAMVSGILLTEEIIRNYITNALKNADYTYLQYSLRHLIIIIFCTGVLPLFFLFPRLRTNIIFTLVVVILLPAGCLYEHVYIFITNYFRDYLPSSWAYYRGSYLEMICWPLGYFLVVLLLTRIKRAIPKRR